MKIPNSENAAVDIDKLAHYVLSPDHERGKHKARVFISALGMVQTDAEALRSTLLSVVRTEDAVLGEKDEYGQRYVLDFLLTWYEKQAVVRSTWIVRTGEDFPRLTSCFVL